MKHVLSVLFLAMTASSAFAGSANVLADVTVCPPASASDFITSMRTSLTVNEGKEILSITEVSTHPDSSASYPVSSTKKVSDQAAGSGVEVTFLSHGEYSKITLYTQDIYLNFEGTWMHSVDCAN